MKPNVRLNWRKIWARVRVAKLTERDFCYRAHIYPYTLTRIRRGEVVGMGTAIKIADALGVSVETLEAEQ